MEGLDLYGALRRRGRWPWSSPPAREAAAVGYAVAELIRLVIGGGLAWAAAASGQITSPVGALAVGVAAPLIVERLARTIPLTEPASPPLAADSPIVPAVQRSGAAPGGLVADVQTMPAGE